MSFEDEIGTALAKACEFDSDNEAVHLARAAKIVRSHMSERVCAIPIACPSEHDT